MEPSETKSSARSILMLFCLGILLLAMHLSTIHNFNVERRNPFVSDYDQLDSNTNNWDESTTRATPYAMRRPITRTKQLETDTCLYNANKQNIRDLDQERRERAGNPTGNRLPDSVLFLGGGIDEPTSSTWRLPGDSRRSP